MEKEKKKKTLTISSNLTKKIDKNFINSNGKKSFSVEKKKQFKGSKVTNRRSPSPQLTKDQDLKEEFYEKRLSSRRLKTLLKKKINPQVKANLNSESSR